MRMFLTALMFAALLTGCGSSSKSASQTSAQNGAAPSGDRSATASGSAATTPDAASSTAATGTESHAMHDGMSSTASSMPAAGGTAGTLAAAAIAGPKLLSLYDQKLVWECPTCGKDYSEPGKCGDDKAQLVSMTVAYTCPSDGEAVDHGGRCPRCAKPADVVKTAMAGSGPAHQ